MADEKPRRVEIGFSGGQVMAVRLTAASLTELLDAIKKGDAGWRELESVDGAVAVDIGQVVFVKRESPEHRVGFSGPLVG